MLTVISVNCVRYKTIALQGSDKKGLVCVSGLQLSTFNPSTAFRGFAKS